MELRSLVPEPDCTKQGLKSNLELSYIKLFVHQEEASKWVGENEGMKWIPDYHDNFLDGNETNLHTYEFCKSLRLRESCSVRIYGFPLSAKI